MSEYIDPIRCPACNGNGAIPVSHPDACAICLQCHGTGDLGFVRRFMAKQEPIGADISRILNNHRSELWQ